MRAATINLRIEPNIRDRAEHAAELQNRSVAAVVRDALAQYLERYEAEQREIREAVAAWDEYQQTGLHVTADETTAWLRSWGTENEIEPPQCHL